MKKTLNFLKIVLPLVALIAFLVHCSKENVFSNQYSASPVTERDVTLPTVADSMLTFSSFQHLWDFIDYLKVQDLDSLTRRSACIYLGIDPDAVEGNYTNHPFCLKLERARGYISLRNIEEDFIISQLNSGNDTINSIVGNPYWKSVLNSYGAVKIGSRIYRFFDNGGAVIVANNDLSAYQAIKNLPYEQILDGYNIRTTFTDLDEWSKYHTISSTGQTTGASQIKDLKILQVNRGNGVYQFSNNSFYESDAVSYEWIYKNGSSSYGVNPNRNFSVDEGVQLKFHKENGTTVTTDFTVLICLITDFSVVNLGNNKIKFSLSGFSGYTINWIFGDGTSSIGNPITHTYNLPAGTSINVTVQVLVDGGVLCSFTKTIILNPTSCGITKEKSSSKTFDNVDGTGQKWRIDAKVFVLNGSVGSSTKTLKRNGLIIHHWNETKVQSISTGFKGYYWRETLVGGTRICDKITTDLYVTQICVSNPPDPNCVTASFLQKTVPESTPRREAGKLSSKHAFKRTANSVELTLDPLVLD